VTRQRAGQTRNFVAISNRDKSHFLLQSFHTRSGAQPVYHLMDYGSKAVSAWSRRLLHCTEFKNELVYTSTPPKYLRSEYPCLLLLAARGEHYSCPLYSCGVNISYRQDLSGYLPHLETRTARVSRNYLWNEPIPTWKAKTLKDWDVVKAIFYAWGTKTEAAGHNFAPSGPPQTRCAVTKRGSTFFFILSAKMLQSVRRHSEIVLIVAINGI
jgi:hypothetical protein